MSLKVLDVLVSKELADPGLFGFVASQIILKLLVTKKSVDSGLVGVQEGDPGLVCPLVSNKLTSN